jgi:hypothetical protein
MPGSSGTRNEMNSGRPRAAAKYGSIIQGQLIRQAR